MAITASSALDATHRINKSYGKTYACILVLAFEGPTGQIQRIAFNGNTSSDPIIASVALDLGVKVSIMGADTRNVDGRAFGTMLISLPEDLNQRRKVLDYLNGFEGVVAEEVR